MASLSKENVRLAVAFMLGAFFGPMVLGLVTGALGRASAKVGRSG